MVRLPSWLLVETHLVLVRYRAKHHENIVNLLDLKNVFQGSK